jgi:hypothetical protein
MQRLDDWNADGSTRDVTLALYETQHRRSLYFSDHLNNKGTESCIISQLRRLLKLPKDGQVGAHP